MEGSTGGEEVPAAAAAAATIVKSIFIYPIKSCRGISVSQAPISPTGLVWDRQWLVVNSKGRGVTQRVEPKLALVEVELPDEAFISEGWKPNKNSYLVLKAPGMRGELKVPLLSSSSLPVCDGISCWEWSGSALDEGDEASNWFSTFLGKPNYRLVRFNNADQTRSVDPDYGSGHKVMFSDQYPFLLISQGSLNALNSFLKDPLPINRFRPNIFVDGCEAFAEDLWKEIRINNTLSFAGVKLCSRCKVPTIDQETAIAGTEPTLTLQTYRSGAVLRPAHKNNKGLVYFGQNLVCNNSFSSSGDDNNKMIIKVGDPVSVIQAVASTNDAPA